MTRSITDNLANEGRAEILDEGGITYAVYANKSGPPTVECRLYGRIMLDGEEYKFDRSEIRVRCKKK